MPRGTAFFHTTGEKSGLAVSAEEKGDVLILRVSDNGRGIPPERLADLGRQPVKSQRGSGTALFQLAQVLALVFGSQAGLALSNRPSAGTDVMLTVPKRNEPW
jgi:two-component system, LytTR family, sensor histidine kinase LytS